MKSVYTDIAYEFSKRRPFPNIIPPSIEIDLSSNCNQDCFYCNSRQYREKTEDVANGGDYINLIRELHEWNMNNNNQLRTICFTGGGEPTLHHRYEDIIKYAIDRGFLVSLVTNGTNLNRLLNIDVKSLRKIAWIGVDVDAGTRELYNKIRKPSANNDFEYVKKSIKDLSSIGVTIDVKVLLTEQNSDMRSIDDIIVFTKDVKARCVYFRPAIIDGNVFEITKEMERYIIKTSQANLVPYRINKTKTIFRDYDKCYATYLLPVFSSDGYVYLCCENRGNSDFALCNWIDSDFREAWGSIDHRNIFNNIDVSQCAPCRPHIHNEEIDKRVKGPFDELFY